MRRTISRSIREFIQPENGFFNQMSAGISIKTKRNTQKLSQVLEQKKVQSERDRDREQNGGNPNAIENNEELNQLVSREGRRV